MNLSRPWPGVAASVVAAAFATAVAAKPPAPSKDGKSVSPASAKTPVADHPDPGSFLRWLLLQNGGPDAIVVGWPELVHAAAGRQVAPLDPADATDAAIVARFGAALDLTLPRLNRPDGAVRPATPLTDGEIAARVGDDLRTTLGASAGVTVTALADPGSSYPALRCVEAASGKTYYFSVVPFPTGGREGALRAVSFQAAEATGRLTTDGCCLLVAVEHNGKTGRDLAFLNWELIDLAKVSLRCTVGFEADQNAVHQPGAVVTDGRKGRD